MLARHAYNYYINKNIYLYLLKSPICLDLLKSRKDSFAWSDWKIAFFGGGSLAMAGGRKRRWLGLFRPNEGK